MTLNRKIVQLGLISIGILLIIATYFLYPEINKKKKALEQDIIIDQDFKTSEKESNKFENVEYKGTYDADKPFIVKSDKAYILNEDPDLVYMSNMQVTLYMDDGRIIIIKSDKGKYNKITYDCFFVNNVKATDGETIVRAENLDLLSTENTAAVYNKVVLINENGSLKADKVDYNFETKNYKVSMFNKDKVKIKLIK